MKLLTSGIAGVRGVTGNLEPQKSMQPEAWLRVSRPETLLAPRRAGYMQSHGQAGRTESESE